MRPIPFDRWLGLFFALAALLVIFVWIPLDTETGIVEKVRRRLTIGDALGPTVAGVFLLLGGLLTALRPNANDPGLKPGHLIWVAKLLILFALSLAIMRWLGPALGALLAEDGYRPLRATAPWKYLGYVAGGTCLITGLTALVTHKITTKQIVIAFAATLIMALAYDLPFDDLILPPNGDV